MISICQNALAVALMNAGTTFPSHASQPAEIADLVGVTAFQIQAASAAVFAPDGKRSASVVCDPARLGVDDDPNISDQTRSSANAPYGSLGCDLSSETSRVGNGCYTMWRFRGLAIHS